MALDDARDDARAGCVRAGWSRCPHHTFAGAGAGEMIAAIAVHAAARGGTWDRAGRRENDAKTASCLPVRSGSAVIRELREWVLIVESLSWLLWFSESVANATEKPAITKNPDRIRELSMYSGGTCFAEAYPSKGEFPMGCKRRQGF